MADKAKRQKDLEEGVLELHKKAKYPLEVAKKYDPMMLAEYLGLRKRGASSEEIQADLIQSFGLSDYSRFMSTLKSEGLGAEKHPGLMKFKGGIIDKSISGRNRDI